METIKKTIFPLSQTIPASDIRGKRVLAQDGTEIGHIKNVYLNPDSMGIEGLLVDRGFLNIDAFIGTDYVESISPEGARLKITPITEYAGKKVFDLDGRKIGHVKDVVRAGTTNEIVSLIIDCGLGKEDLVVSKRTVQNIGENVLLNERILNRKNGMS